MHRFRSGSLQIAYVDQGDGDPVLLVHGFASNIRANWADPGWISLLRREGYRVVAIDNRGHGASDKPRDVASYALVNMVEDARALLDHLGLERADVMGYSMGARIAALLAHHHPARVRSAVFGGMGANMVRPMRGTEEIAAALEAPSLDEVTSPVGRTFRAFADKTGSDRLALAACMRGSREPIGADVLGALRCPVLVAVGTNDDIAAPAEELANLIPGAMALPIPGRDHMLAVGDRVYKTGVVEFLRRRP
ncbi:MAG: alpha/beta hydrolase [Hyphomicrobiaceae bacterium]|nr:alpha/beta hydrolase [Hyphomicrobiaceae bacterium]